MHVHSHIHTHTQRERETYTYTHTHTHTHKQIKRQEQSVINFEQEGKRFIVVTNKLLNEEAELSPRVFVGGGAIQFAPSILPQLPTTIALRYIWAFKHFGFQATNKPLYSDICFVSRVRRVIVRHGQWGEEFRIFGGRGHGLFVQSDCSIRGLYTGDQILQVSDTCIPTPTEYTESILRVYQLVA